MVSKTELYNSFYAAAAGIEKEQLDGWQIDWDNPPAQFVFDYEVTYFRETAPEPKRSRAEILADARAAKAAKKGT